MNDPQPPWELLASTPDPIPTPTTSARKAQAIHVTDPQPLTAEELEQDRELVECLCDFRAHEVGRLLATIDALTEQRDRWKAEAEDTTRAYEAQHKRIAELEQEVGALSMGKSYVEARRAEARLERIEAAAIQLVKVLGAMKLNGIADKLVDALRGALKKDGVK